MPRLSRSTPAVILLSLAASLPACAPKRIELPTGTGSPYGTGMQKMIVVAAETVNAAGGAAGRQIQVFAEDSQTRME